MNIETNEKEYLIHEKNIESFKAKVEKLNKKAVKLDFPEIKYDMEVVTKQDKETKNVEVFFKVKLNGEAPKLNGWKFIARLETIKGNKDNLIFVAPNESIPALYRETGSQCEHCNSNRYRKYTFVLQNENGEYKQVGSSCLKDFLGHTNPHSYAKYLEWMEELSVLAEESEKVERGSYTMHDYKYPLDYFVSYVAEYIKQTGYFLSKGKADQQERPSTADSVWNEIHNKNLKKENKVVQEISEESIELANKAIEWATGLKEKGNLNDYQHNLYLSCLVNLVDYKSKGIVASLITAYQYEMNLIEKKEAEKKGEAESNFFGEVGQRSEFTLTVFKKKGFSTQFGYTMLHMFKDDKGNVATWFSSNKEFDLNETVTIKATVKEHKEYEGMKQTVLTRCTEVKKNKKAS